jgi:hypothetical protein
MTDPDTNRRLRVRALVDAYYPILLGVAILLVLVLGFWTYQVYAVEEVQTEQRTFTQWSESTELEHSALIVNESVPFERGQRVENRPIYYTTISDDLNITYRYEHTADTELNVSTDIRLRFRSTSDEEIFWEVTEPRASAGPDSVSGEDNHTVEASINIATVQNTIAEIEEQLGTEGSVDITVIAATTVDGTADGQMVSRTHESRMTLGVSETSFRVIETETIDQENTATDTVEIPQEASLSEMLASLLTFSGSLTILGALAFVRYRGYIALSEEEAELLEIYQQEQEFAQWITTGTFPSERDYEATILVDDLEGLVDVAIDTNKRVIKDEQLGVSTVLDSDYAYIYVRPDSPASDWLFSQADTTIEEMEQFQF